MQCRLVVGNRWFGLTCFYSSSSTEQSKNSGNRWRHYCIWDSGDWSMGNVREPVMLLEHVVATRTLGVIMGKVSCIGTAEELKK